MLNFMADKNSKITYGIFGDCACAMILEKDFNNSIYDCEFAVNHSRDINDNRFPVWTVGMGMENIAIFIKY